jgi:type VI secretion system protein ImpA
MDRETALAIKEAPITDGDSYNFLDYHDSKKFDIPDNIDLLDTAEQQKFRELAAQAERENRVTADKWKKAISQSKRAFYEELDIAIVECQSELKNLNLVIEEKYEINQAPSLPNLKKTLSDIKEQTDKLLKLKREEEPDVIEESAEENFEGEEVTDGNVSNEGQGQRASSKGAINNRKEALKRLSELAEFFRKTEPHSPVSYLITRAVKWGNMPLETWLQDVIKDETILFQLRQTLGFNTNMGNENETDVSSDPTSV